EERLEELTHDAVRERALQLRASGGQHLDSGIGREGLRLTDEGRLADARRPLDREEPSAARGLGDQAGHHRDLRLTLDESERLWFRSRCGHDAGTAGVQAR